MGKYICETTETTADRSNDKVECVASWVLIQDQMKIAGFVYAGLFVLVLVWTLISWIRSRKLNPNEKHFSHSLRKWARTSKFAIIMVGFLDQ